MVYTSSANFTLETSGEKYLLRREMSGTRNGRYELPENVFIIIIIITIANV